MTPSDLRECSAHRAAALPPLLRALWHDAHGRWDDAHTIAQSISTPHGSWVHAYLHRKEGDDANAGFWYSQAGKPHATGSLQAEWNWIASELIANSWSSPSAPVAS